MWLKQLKNTDENTKGAIYFVEDQDACDKLILDKICKELDGPTYPEEGEIISTPDYESTSSINIE